LLKAVLDVVAAFNHLANRFLNQRPILEDHLMGIKNGGFFLAQFFRNLSPDFADLAAGFEQTLFKPGDFILPRFGRNRVFWNIKVPLDNDRCRATRHTWRCGDSLHDNLFTRTHKRLIKLDSLIPTNVASQAP